MNAVPRKAHVFLVATALAVWSTIGLASPVLVDPPPISVPAGLDEDSVARSIRTGIAKRGWVVSRKDPGFMEATLHIRSHVARVGITYDSKAIQVRYLDSTNLDYEVKKGVPHIHRNYLKWVNNIVQNINVELQLAELELEGAPKRNGQD